MNTKNELKILVMLIIAVTAILSLTSTQPANAVGWHYGYYADIDDSLTQMQGYLYGGLDEFEYPYYPIYYWEYYIYEDTGCMLPSSSGGPPMLPIQYVMWVWTRSNSFIRGQTGNYSGLEVYAETDITSSVTTCYEWEGPGQSIGGTAQYYYSVYCGYPLNWANYQMLEHNHRAFAAGGTQYPAEISFETSTDFMGFFPNPDWYIYFPSYTTFDVSSDNTSINPPLFDYDWPYWADSGISIYNQYNEWINDWWWQVDIGYFDNRQWTTIDDGETLVYLNLSVSNCTYAYTYLDEYSHAYGETNYNAESWGQLYF